jgi:hypothetical protein
MSGGLGKEGSKLERIASLRYGDEGLYERRASMSVHRPWNLKR